MKTLNKLPAINKNIQHGTPDGYRHNYNFIFSDELPYMRKNKAQKNKEYRELRKG